MITIGSLFSGIGGLERGLEQGLVAAGHAARVVYQVERSAFCRHLLARHYPDAQRYDDVRTVGAAVLPPVDLLCGGFPCQDVSSSGKGAGLDGARSGLWWEFARIIGETRPRWVVVENVASGARRWLPFVRRALGARGYDSLPLGIAACEVGARHRRERIFVVAWDAAHADSVGGAARQAVTRDQRSGRPEPEGGVAAHHESCGLAVGQRVAGGVVEEQPPAGGGLGLDEGAISPGWGLPARPWMVRGVHGFPGGVDRRRWLRAGWTPARLRAARIAALGNAVVPAQVEPVGRLIGAWLGGEE